MFTPIPAAEIAKTVGRVTEEAMIGDSQSADWSTDFRLFPHAHAPEARAEAANSLDP